jgi:hypothetical protein
MTKLLSSCADCLDTWELQTPEIFRTCPGLYRDAFALKQLGRAVKNSSPSGAEVKKKSIALPLLPVCEIMTCYRVTFYYKDCYTGGILISTPITFVSLFSNYGQNCA